MATPAVTYTFAAHATAIAAQVNTNFTDLTSFITANCIQKDGSLAMTSQLTLVGDPSTANHAARKAYIDGILPVGEMTSYTPTWASSGTQPAINNGTIVGRYARVGNKGCVFRVVVIFGTTTTGGTGTYTLTLPFTAVTRAGDEQQVHSKAFVAGGLQFSGNAYIPSGSTTVAPYFPSSASNCSLGQAINSSTGAVSEGTPRILGGYTWTSGFNFIVHGFYETA